MKVTRTGVLVQPSDIPGGFTDVLNAGCHLENGEIILFCRLDNEGLPPEIRKIKLDLNYRIKAIDKKPAIYGQGPLENRGCEDPRITEIEGIHYVTYTSVAQANGRGCRTRVSLASTTDFVNFYRHGVIFPDFGNTKNGILLPEKVNDQFVGYIRPDPKDRIWGGYSLDFNNWYGCRPIMAVRPGMWDGHHLGPGAPPIKTDLGWLSCYHGANEINTYVIGLALFSLDNPFKLLARSDFPILYPLKPYEKIGRVPNVVFTCGAFNINDTLVLIYSGADHCIAGAEISLKYAFYLLKPVKGHYFFNWPRR